MQEFYEISSIFFLLIAIYTFALYPFVLKILAKFFSKPIERDFNFQPEVTILIAAYNEEKYIGDCIKSILDSDYPLEKLRILIGIDGKSDRTDEVIKEFQKDNHNIQFWNFERSGKNLILNKLIKKVETQFVAFMDADLRINKNSINSLTSYMINQNVGGAISALNIIDININNDNTGREGETVYQDMESIIRSLESNIWGTINAIGSLYLVNKDFLNYQPNDKVCDDLFNVYFIAKCKKRLIFDKNNIVSEVREKTLIEESKRRIRTVSGGLSAALANWQLLLPNYGWSSFFIWSHKFLRYFSPLIIIYTLFVTFILPNESLLKEIYLISFSIFAIMSFLGWIFEKMKINYKILRLSLFVLSMNFGFLLGIIRFIFGGQNSKWEKIG